MLLNSAEESFQRGMTALSNGQPREAMAYFEAALEIEAKFQVAQHQPRYLSFYGLCMALSGERLYEAIKLCRGALKLEEFNTAFHLNLSRVLLMGDRRREAHAVLIAGLSLHPDHQQMIRLIRGMGMRKRPPLPFLARNNPFNIMLGRIRAIA